MLLYCTSCSARADELVMGQVIAVDRENSSITLHLSDTSLKDIETGKRDIEIKLHQGTLPGGLHRGRMVRVWLKEGGTGSTFTANRIRASPKPTA